MTGQELIEVVVLVVCFFVAALASGTETALTSVGRLRVRFLAEQGSQAANILQRLRAAPEASHRVPAPRVTEHGVQRCPSDEPTS